MNGDQSYVGGSPDFDETTGTYRVTVSEPDPLWAVLLIAIVAVMLSRGKR